MQRKTVNFKLKAKGSLDKYDTLRSKLMQSTHFDISQASDDASKSLFRRRKLYKNFQAYKVPVNIKSKLKQSLSLVTTVVLLILTLFNFANKFVFDRFSIHDFGLHSAINSVFATEDDMSTTIGNALSMYYDVQADHFMSDMYNVHSLPETDTAIEDFNKAMSNIKALTKTDLTNGLSNQLALAKAQGINKIANFPYTANNHQLAVTHDGLMLDLITNDDYKYPTLRIYDSGFNKLSLQEIKSNATEVSNALLTNNAGTILSEHKEPSKLLIMLANNDTAGIDSFTKLRQGQFNEVFANNLARVDNDAAIDKIINNLTTDDTVLTDVKSELQAYRIGHLQVYRIGYFPLQNTEETINEIGYIIYAGIEQSKLAYTPIAIMGRINTVRGTVLEANLTQLEIENQRQITN